MFIICLYSDDKFTKAYTHKHVEYSWRGQDELINDVFVWAPTHGRAMFVD